MLKPFFLATASPVVPIAVSPFHRVTPSSPTPTPENPKSRKVGKSERPEVETGNLRQSRPELAYPSPSPPKERKVWKVWKTLENSLKNAVFPETLAYLLKNEDRAGCVADVTLGCRESSILILKNNKQIPGES